MSFRANAIGLTLAGAGLTLLGAVALAVLPGMVCEAPGTMVCEADISIGVSVAWGLGLLTGVAGAVLVVVDRTRSARDGPVSEPAPPAPAAMPEAPRIPEGGVRRRDRGPDPAAVGAPAATAPGASAPGAGPPQNGTLRRPGATDVPSERGPVRGPAARATVGHRAAPSPTRGTAPAGAPGGGLRKRSPGGVQKRTR